jgi:hypothetical protein
MRVRLMTAVPLLRRLVTSVLPRRPGFALGSIHVVFVMNKVAPGQFSCQYYFTLALHTHISSGG